MCVLTYVPDEDGNVVITHNRDENIHRPVAIPPRNFLINGRAVVFPQDPESSGTWLAHDQQWVACLLNGGFIAHKRKEGYQHSRGSIIPMFFKYRDIYDFIEAFNPYGIEPFTLILYNASYHTLDQITWDEQVLYRQHLPAQEPHIWSSSTLYSPTVKANRAAAFGRMLSTKPNAAAIFDFHRLNINNDPNTEFFVNIEDKIQTVAIAQVQGGSQHLELTYQSFQHLILFQP